MTEKVKGAMLCMARQCWEVGIAAQALMETGDTGTLALTVYDMILRQSSDGRLCNVENTPAVTDSAFCIPAVLFMAGMAGSREAAGRLLKRGQCKRAAERNIDFLLRDADRSKDGVLYHMRKTSEIWADSAAFLPYSLILSGHVEEGIKQLNGIKKRLLDPESGLYYHIWDDEKRIYKRRVLWGTGNGWILTGTLRCLLEIIKSYPENSQFTEEKEALISDFRKQLGLMINCLTPDHLLNDVLGVTDSYKESEASAMLAYAIYRGVYSDIIDRENLEAAEKIRESLLEKIDDTGVIWDAASSPDFITPGTSAECQAHFLMMEAARKKLNL